MTRVNLHTRINFQDFSKHLPPIRNLDWRVKCFAALVLGALVIMIVKMRGHSPSRGIRQLIHKKTEGKITDAKLGFSDAILNQTVIQKNVTWLQPQTWSFREVQTYTLRALEDEFKKQTGSFILINSRHSLQILDFLPFGLPEGKTYEESERAEQSQCWLQQILQKLVEKGYIESFILGSSSIFITKKIS